MEPLPARSAVASVSSSSDALASPLLLLAAANRFRLTPALNAALEAPERAPAAVAELKRSIVIEAGAALTVLALVAWLGRLAPIVSQ